MGSRESVVSKVFLSCLCVCMLLGLKAVTRFSSLDSSVYMYCVTSILILVHYGVDEVLLIFYILKVYLSLFIHRLLLIALFGSLRLQLCGIFLDNSFRILGA